MGYKHPVKICLSILNKKTNPLFDPQGASAVQNVGNKQHLNSNSLFIEAFVDGGEPSACHGNII